MVSFHRIARAGIPCLDFSRAMACITAAAIAMYVPLVIIPDAVFFVHKTWPKQIILRGWLAYKPFYLYYSAVTEYFIKYFLLSLSISMNSSATSLNLPELLGPKAIT